MNQGSVLLTIQATSLSVQMKSCIKMPMSLPPKSYCHFEILWLLLSTTATAMQRPQRWRNPFVLGALLGRCPGVHLSLLTVKYFKQGLGSFVTKYWKKAKSNAIKKIYTHTNIQNKYKGTQRRLTYLISSAYLGTHWGGTIYLHAL